ncbi:TetR/AcrR family transcriptional regulator [Embleya sp. AB8]|uniref:TetR/AcrR family transcriptional regulator n=1 Tax=Embleya sp. AB8 TaxID=3156304 RepID=UPI003C7179D9
MAETDTATPRERYRAQVRAEIKEHAWAQIATDGASALSLNAIAKRMGLSGPALYRYYAGRDELITELVTDAYRSLADTLRAAGASAGPDPAALAYALRDWALADPQRYLLIFGTPVPGYHAPDDVTAIADGIMAIMLDACTAVMPADGPADGLADGLAESAASPLDAHLADLADHRQWAREHPASPAVLHRALVFWTRLHGVLSLELAGHFTGMAFDAALLYAAELEDLFADRHR